MLRDHWLEARSHPAYRHVFVHIISAPPRTGLKYIVLDMDSSGTPGGDMTTAPTLKRKGTRLDPCVRDMQFMGARDLATGNGRS